MQKKLIRLALISSFIIPQMRAWGGPEEDQQKQLPVYEKILKSGHRYSSIESFLDFMAVPLYNQAYLNAQKLRLKTVGDLTLERFLDDSPMMQKLVPGLRKQFLAELQGTNSDNLTGGFLITKKSDPRLHNQLMRVMRAQGFSRKQMARAKFYRKMGEVNAYAYTASVDEVGFVLLSGLDDIADPAQLRGVMGHELGHIRSGHVFIGILDSVLQIQTMKQLVVPNPAAMTMAEMAKWESIRNKMSLAASQNISKRFKLDPDQVSDAFMKMMKNTDDTISRSFSDVQRTTVLQQYLDMKISIYEGMEMNPSDIQLLKEYRDHLSPNVLTKVDPSQALILFQQVMTMADSRNMETSADAFGNIVVKPIRAGTMDETFLGGDNTTKLALDKLAISVQFIRDQVNLDRKNSTRAQYYNKIGGAGSSDHPLSALRVIKQASFDQHIDRISLSNRFLQKVVLLDQFQTEIKKRQEAIFELQLQNITKNVDKLMAEIELYKQGIVQQKMNISDLLSDPRFLDGNPRTLNLLDFRMAELQIGQMELTSFQENRNNAIFASISEEEKTQIEAVLQAVVDRAKKDDLLQQAIVTLEAEIAVLSKGGPAKGARLQLRQTILDQAKLALDPSASLKETLAVRTVIGKTSKSRDRISLETPTLGPLNSNTQWDASAPPFKDETPAALSKACQDLIKGK